MSSFQKKFINYSVPGTKTSLRNGLLLTSTGNISLDGILNGGLPMGSILLIEEDKYGTYSNVLSKFFIAEGAVHDHGIFLASLDDDPRKIITKIPMPKPLRNTVTVDNNINKTDEQEDSMRIAWRYNRLPNLNNEHHLPIQNNIIAAEHYFDLNKIIDPADINKLDIIYFDGKEPLNQFNSSSSSSTSTSTSTNCGFTNPIYLKCLQSIQDKLTSDKLYEIPYGSATSNTSTTDLNIVRICINSLGSPIWYGENYLNDLCRFLTVLKGLVRNYLTVTCITIPMHLLKFNNPMVIHRIRNLVDISIELESFAGSDKETNTYFKEYLGLFSITKLGAINTLSPFAQKSYDLAFKLKRKNFMIEKLHLPPELQEISNNNNNNNKTQQSVASMQCGGGSTKHLLEF